MKHLRRTLRFARRVLLAGTIAANAAPALADTPDARLNALLAEYRCPIAAMLARIHKHPLKHEHRYFILWSTRRPELYTQCIFFDEDRQVHCEAASGFYFDKVKAYMTPPKLAALEALGFSTDGAQGNFIIERPVTGASSFDLIAELYVETLTRVYDLDIGDKLAFDAPLLSKARGRRVMPNRHCKTLTSEVFDPRRSVSD